MLSNRIGSRQAPSSPPDYLELVEFLVESLLESPESLSIDCEQVNNNQRVWVRVAFEGADTGRVFGRGGRNLQAIRSVLQTAAAAAGQSLYLDVYEGEEFAERSPKRTRYSPARKFSRRQPPTRRPEGQRFPIKPRFSE